MTSPADNGLPSERSAVIIRAALPAALERLRRRCVEDAADGVPAHVTLLYPFVEPERLDGGTRRRLRTVADRHAPFEYDLAGPAAWPDTVYAAVDPVEPFVRLQRDLQAAFPAFPLYGGRLAWDFVPHVTVAEGACVDDPIVEADRGWRSLPRRGRAAAIEVIAAGADGRWRRRWRIAFGSSGGRAVDRMRR